MKPAVSIGLMILIYLGAAFALNEQTWLATSIPPALAVVIAWFVYRPLSLTVTAVVLLIVAVVLPLGVLLFGVPATDSTSGNFAALASKLSLVDVLSMVGPVIIGLVVLAVLRAIGSSKASPHSA